MEFNNPVFEADDELSSENSEYEIDLFAEIDIELESVLDYTTLKAGRSQEEDKQHKYRNGPVFKDTEPEEQIDIKLGSIEPNTSLNVHQLYPHVCKTPPINYTHTQIAFLQCVSNLSQSNDDAQFDYQFVDVCLKDEACTDCVDVFGQTIMHEIAREWCTDIAVYLKHHKVPIDKADVYGRTPLFVAIAGNNFEMIKWLIENGANINAKTVAGEGQQPIHYAAKYTNINGLLYLMDKGACPNVLDDNLRSPLHVAAEQGRDDVCRLLLYLELPAGTYVSSGVSTIQCLIEKNNSDVAIDGLSQFFEVDQFSGNVKFYLSNLGMKRGSRILKQKTDSTSISSCLGSRAKKPLQTIVDQNNLTLIVNRTILQLLTVMRQKFGWKYLFLNVFLYLLFTFMWTVAVIITPDPINKKDALYYTVTILYGLGFLLTLFFVFKVFMEYYVEMKYTKNFIAWKKVKMARELLYCHPRWVNERRYLEGELELLHKIPSFWSDGWNIMEAFLLILSIVYFSLSVVCFTYPNQDTLRSIRKGFACIFLLACWLRLNRSMMFFQSIGPFITMLGRTINATVQFGFLFFEFFIPFMCALWVLFGGVRKGSNGGEYEKFNDALYQLFLLTIVGDYSYDPLKVINETAAQLLVSIYFVLVSCVCVNLYIALLSEMFSNVYAESTAIAYMNEAKMMLLIEKLFPRVQQDFEDYMQINCAPQVLFNRRKRDGTDEYSKQTLLKNVQNQIKESSRDLEAVLTDQLQMKDLIETLHRHVIQFANTNAHKVQDYPPILTDAVNLHRSYLPVPINRPVRSQIKKLIQAADEIPEKFTALKGDFKERFLNR